MLLVMETIMRRLIPLLSYFVGLLCCQADAFGYASGDSSYFPLRIGNQWTLVRSTGEASVTEKVVDTVQVKGDLYFRFDSVRYETNVLYRFVGQKVYRYLDTTAALWYDFSADSATWTIPERSLSVTVVATRDTVTVPAGKFVNCRRFFFLIGPDAAWTEWFARGFGLVKRENITIAGANTWDLRSAIITSVPENPGPAPGLSFDLGQNYPNPFNPSTVIRYSVPSLTGRDLGRSASGSTGQVPALGHVSLKIYDLLGREIVTLVEGLITAGEHEVAWNAKGLAGGVYIYRLQVGTLSNSRKLLLIR